jgi:hypothetical protein
MRFRLSPESWPTADALRRAPSRARAGVSSAPTPASRAASAPAAAPSSSRSPTIRGGRPPKPGNKVAVSVGEPKIVTEMRNRFVNWVGEWRIVLIDAVTGGGFGWGLMVSVIWGGIYPLPRYMAWQAGYSWRDVLHRPITSDAAEAARYRQSRRQGQLAPRQRENSAASSDKVQQVAGDYQAIMRVVEGCPSEQPLPTSGDRERPDEARPGAGLNAALAERPGRTARSIA